MDKTLLNIVSGEFRPFKRIAAAVEPVMPDGGWPRITVITPVLNRADMIETAIESVQAQDYPDVEHIVMDGGSTDGTLERLTRHSHLKVVSEPDRGSHHAMNKGIALATGSIIGFLNSDDAYASGIFHVVARHIAERRGVAVTGKCFLSSLITGLGSAADAELCHAEVPDWYFLETLYATPGFNSYFFARHVLAELRGVDECYDIAADRDFLIRMILAHYQPTFLDLPGYCYRRHEGSRTLGGQSQTGERILAEHRTIATRHLTVSALSVEKRRALLQWRAWETARLLRHYQHGGRWVDAVSLLQKALSEDLFWPCRVPAAMSAMRQLRSIYGSSG